MDQEIHVNEVEEVQLLSAYEDDHGGVIVEMKEPMDSNHFNVILEYSLSKWKLQRIHYELLMKFFLLIILVFQGAGKKGVWIKLPIKLVNLVEIAVKEGFLYHHAEPNYLMLVNWIADTPSTIPINATHRLRIGAVVVNDKRELLVIREKHGRSKGTGFWKIPTGVVNEHEDIFAGARREVKEETGINTEFMDILAFRQVHKSFFEKSDLFFICMLRPVSVDIQTQDSEIEAAQWMPIVEYANQPIPDGIQGQSIFKYVSDICLAKMDKDYTGFSPLPITSHSDDKISYLYANKNNLDTV